MPLVKYTDHTPIPWANGGGTTVELISLDTSISLTPDLPPWRLSIASLHSPAPFSALPEMVRQFMPVGGNVTLLIDEVRTPVADGTVFRFSGASTVELVELSTPCHAINLMTFEPSPGTPNLQLTSVAAGEAAHPDTHFAVRLAAEPAASQFDLTHLTDPAAALGYEAACTGPWAAIAKS